MQPIPEPGAAARHAFVVTPAMCPHFEERLVHPVCATWTLVNQMEYAGRLVILPALEADEEAVGARFEITHRSPAAIGSTVEVTARVLSATRRRLTCSVQATVGDRLVAEGEFVQISMPKADLAARFAAVAPGA